MNLGPILSFKKNICFIGVLHLLKKNLILNLKLNFLLTWLKKICELLIFI